MNQIVGQTKDDFVYLHYPSPERSVLLVFAKDEPDYSASLAHQAFVQFIKAFVSNPPLWIREGVAVCFESAKWDDKAGKLDYPENLAWLETVKSLKDRNLLIPSTSCSRSGRTRRAQLDVFYPQAWAMTSFLLNSDDKSYNRLLWDAVAALRKDASLEDNENAVTTSSMRGTAPMRSTKPSTTTLPNAILFPSSSTSVSGNTPTRHGPTQARLS